MSTEYPATIFYFPLTMLVAIDISELTVAEQSGANIAQVSKGQLVGSAWVKMSV